MSAWPRPVAPSAVTVSRRKGMSKARNTWPRRCARAANPRTTTPMSSGSDALAEQDHDLASDGLHLGPLARREQEAHARERPLDRRGRRRAVRAAAVRSTKTCRSRWASPGDEYARDCAGNSTTWAPHARQASTSAATTSPSGRPRLGRQRERDRRRERQALEEPALQRRERGEAVARDRPLPRAGPGLEVLDGGVQPSAGSPPSPRSHAAR